MMQHPGSLLIILGLLIAIVGVLWILFPSVPWLGNLPGDIRLERGNVRVYFPIVTCILISALLTVVVWLVRLFSR